MVDGMADLKSSKDINFGIVGTGYMAQEYVEVIKSLKIKKTISVLGSSFLKSNSFIKKHDLDYAAKSISDLKNKFNVNFLIICVREEKLYQLVDKIIKYDWKCLCEKPLGYNFNQTNKIVSKLKKNNIKNFFIGLNRRSYFSTRSAIKILKKDSFKKKRKIEIIDQENLEYQKKIGTNKKVINNFMFVNSIHLIDYTNIFCRGNIKRIETLSPYKGNIPHVVSKIIYFTSGDECIYKCYWNLEARWSITIKSGKSFIKLKPLEKIFSNYKLKKSSTDKKLKKWDKIYKPGLKFQLIEFLKNNQTLLLTPEMYLSLAKRIKKIYS
jgi:predicted dehydrogenase